MIQNKVLAESEMDAREEISRECSIRDWFGKWTSSKSCCVNMVDNVYFENGQLAHWYAMGSDGLVREMEEEEKQLDRMVQEFVFKANANVENEMQYAAWVDYRDGTRKLVTSGELERNVVEDTVVSMQHYMGNSTLNGEIQVLKGFYREKEAVQVVECMVDRAGGLCTQNRIRQDGVERMMVELVRYFKNPASLTAEFVMDDQRQVCLTRIEQVQKKHVALPVLSKGGGKWNKVETLVSNNDNHDRIKSNLALSPQLKVRKKVKGKKLKQLTGTVEFYGRHYL